MVDLSGNITRGRLEKDPDGDMLWRVPHFVEVHYCVNRGVPVLHGVVLVAACMALGFNVRAEGRACDALYYYCLLCRAQYASARLGKSRR